MRFAELDTVEFALAARIDPAQNAGPRAEWQLCSAGQYLCATIIVVLSCRRLVSASCAGAQHFQISRRPMTVMPDADPDDAYPSKNILRFSAAGIALLQARHAVFCRRCFGHPTAGACAARP